MKVKKMMVMILMMKMFLDTWGSSYWRNYDDVDCGDDDGHDNGDEDLLDTRGSSYYMYDNDGDDDNDDENLT